MTSMVAASQRWALIQFAVQRSPGDTALGQMSKLQMTSRVLPVTGLVCLCFTLTFELAALSPERLWHAQLALHVLGIALGVATLTIAEMKLVQLTSAVAMQILGTLHQIPLVIAGVIVFDDQVSSLTAAGFVCCILGALNYTKARMEEARGLDDAAAAKVQQVACGVVLGAHADLPRDMQLAAPPRSLAQRTTTTRLGWVP